MFARPATALAVIIATGLLAAGCGSSPTDSSEDFEGPEAEVAEVITSLSNNMQKNRSDVICRTLLSPEAVAKIRKAQHRSCEKVLPSLLGPSDTKIKVTDVKISGDTAVAKVEMIDSDGNTVPSQLRLKKYQGVWKLQFV